MCLIEFQLFKTLERDFTHSAFREEPSANYFISSSYSFSPPPSYFQSLTLDPGN